MIPRIELLSNAAAPYIGWARNKFYDLERLRLMVNVPILSRKYLIDSITVTVVSSVVRNFVRLEGGIPPEIFEIYYATKQTGPTTPWQYHYWNVLDEVYELRRDTSTNPHTLYGTTHPSFGTGEEAEYVIPSSGVYALDVREGFESSVALLINSYSAPEQPYASGRNETFRFVLYQSDESTEDEDPGGNSVGTDSHHVEARLVEDNEFVDAVTLPDDPVFAGAFIAATQYGYAVVNWPRDWLENTFNGTWVYKYRRLSFFTNEHELIAHQGSILDPNAATFSNRFLADYKCLIGTNSFVIGFNDQFQPNFIGEEDVGEFYKVIDIWSGETGNLLQRITLFQTVGGVETNYYDRPLYYQSTSAYSAIYASDRALGYFTILETDELGRPMFAYFKGDGKGTYTFVDYIRLPDEATTPAGVLRGGFAIQPDILIPKDGEI